MSEGIFAFAERHDLDVLENPSSAGLNLPSGDAPCAAGGSLPSGIEGYVAPVRRPAGGDDPAVDFGALVTRVPASLALLPYVTCRDAKVQGLTDRLIGPGGLIPLVEHHEFESIELNRRYRIGAFKGVGENRLRQLFSPTFIDWMAHEAPEGIFFELFGGMLAVNVKGEFDSPEGLERLCGLAGRVAERIASEAAESEGLAGSGFPVHPKTLEQEREREAILERCGGAASFNDYRDALRRVEPLVRKQKRGFFSRLVGMAKADTESLAFEAVLRGHAARRGLTVERGTDFLARHLSAPMPLAPPLALEGDLPPLGGLGELFAVQDADRNGSKTFAPGLLVTVRAGPDGILLAGRVGDARPLHSFGGFWAQSDEGLARESKATRADLGVRARLVEALPDGASVGVYRWTSLPLPQAVSDWVSSGGTVMCGGGRIAALGPSVEAERWSGEVLDAHTGAAAPALLALSSPLG
jgi:hypothetical protein